MNTKQPPDLDEFKSDRPLADKIVKMEDELKSKDEEICLQRKKALGYQLDIYMTDYSKSISEKEFEKANRLLSGNEYLGMEGLTSEDGPIDMRELSALSDYIYQYPSRNIDIIKLLRQRKKQSCLEN